MQAQVPLNPYLGLWSRLREFRPEELGKALVDREVVRIVAMRATVHLLTADDALLLRALCQPVLDGELARHRDVAPALRGVDLAPVLAYGAQPSGRAATVRRPAASSARRALPGRQPDRHGPRLPQQPGPGPDPSPRRVGKGVTGRDDHR